MKYAFIAKERAHYPLRMLCRVLSVSAWGFYDPLRRRARSKPDPEAGLRKKMRAIHTSSRHTDGRPRLHRALRAQGHQISAKRVARLMGEEGLRGRRKGRGKPRTTDSRHSRPGAENLLARQFAPEGELAAWVGDITYIPTREGWLYLAVVLSLRTRQVLGYSLAERMPEELVRRAFLNAWAACPATGHILFHSDRGSQYASERFRDTIAALGFTSSMSRKDNGRDNAVGESFFATLKNEEVTEAYDTQGEAELGIAHYIHGFYNPVRLHPTLGYVSPNDYASTMKQTA